jgi:ABC-type multidrug transport system permease subunit
MNRRSALGQLFLLRLRDFFRKPAAVMWVYGFPLFLAITLGLAFSGSGPDAPMSPGEAPVAIRTDRDPDAAEALGRQLRDRGLEVRQVHGEAGRHTLRSGRVSLVIDPASGGYDYYFDPARSDSLLARYRVDNLIQRWKGGASAWPTTDHQSSEPGDHYIDFLIPGLTGFNLMSGGLWAVGFVVVDVRVRKLLKRFLATPMRRGDCLLSVVDSRLLFLLPEMLVLVLAGWLLFGVPVRGDPLMLALVVLVGGAAFAGVGLLLACRTERVETVSGLINVLSMPLWMFSGTFFSAGRFPAAAQPLIQASPLTHLNEALREVMLDGASLAQVSWRLAILPGWTAVSSCLVLRWFRWH